jgi:hypothetical protein
MFADSAAGLPSWGAAVLRPYAETVSQNFLEYA